MGQGEGMNKKLSPWLIIAGVAGAIALMVSRAKAKPPEEIPPTEPGLANLYGIVTDSATGKPLQGVRVSLGALTTLTDSSGYYQFTDLEIEQYGISFQKEGYETQEGPIFLQEGNNELNPSIQPSEGPPPEEPTPSPISVSGFHYVYQGAYTWVLSGTMIHGDSTTHIGFSFTNTSDASVPGVSVKMKLVNQHSIQTGAIPDIVLAPALDQYKAGISQPFTMPSGVRSVWYGWSPVSNVTVIDAVAIAEVYIDNILVAKASMPFVIEYG